MSARNRTVIITSRGQREHLKPGRTDETANLNDEVAA